jgi:trigger factor
MQVKEVLKNGSATKDDKVVIKMEMFKDKVPVEGGQADKHAVYLNEQHYIPGMQDHLVGLKKDDTKEFSLKFPDEHYQKHLAGKNIDFKVIVNDVYELQYPELNDEFAKSLGQENMDKLKTILIQNLTKEAEQRDTQRVDTEIFDSLTASSEFGDIPEVLINSEKQKIFHELKHNLEKYGITMEKYLADLKKTEDEIFKDFTEQAIKRVKAALISRQVALNNNLHAEPAEIEKEIELIKKTYPDDKNVEENIKRPEVKETITVAIQNRKVVAWLREKILEK